jgi:hypothetical protein
VFLRNRHTAYYDIDIRLIGENALLPRCWDYSWNWINKIFLFLGLNYLRLIQEFKLMISLTKGSASKRSARIRAQQMHRDKGAPNFNSTEKRGTAASPLAGLKLRMFQLFAPDAARKLVFKF